MVRQDLWGAQRAFLAVPLGMPVFKLVVMLALMDAHTQCANTLCDTMIVY